MKAPRIPPQSEKDFQRQVQQLAKQCGWLCAHFRPSLNQRGKWQTAVQADGAGFLDWVFVRGPRLIFAELKSDNGRLSPEQERWIAALREAGQAVYVWRPCLWSRVVEILA